MGNPVTGAIGGLFRSGAGAALDPRRAKRIVLSNQISLSVALLSLPFILIYLKSGSGLMGLLEIPILLGYASVHLFNKAGHTRFSRISPEGELPRPARPETRSASPSPFADRVPKGQPYPDAARHLEARLASDPAQSFEGPLPPSSRSLRILMVDDHELNRKLLGGFLASYGLAADSAASAEEAIEACVGKAYHVVFMDCHMPGMDGYECSRRLRVGPRSGPRPTIIGVTADAMENNLRRCLDAGMDALLVKPIMAKQLRGLLAECAGRAIG